MIESSVKLGLGKKKKAFWLVWLQFQFNKFVVCEVIIMFFFIKPDHKVFLTLKNYKYLAMDNMINDLLFINIFATWHLC